MITLEMADNALKQAYLCVVANQLNTNIDPVIGKIAHTTSDVWGKEIIAPLAVTIDYDSNGSFSNYLQVESELKNIYGKINVSDKAIRASQNSAGVFVNLLNDEMENMIKDTSYHIKNAFYSEDKPGDWLSEEEKKNYQPLKLSGLKDLFDNTQKTLYGIDRDKYNFKPKEFTIKEFNVGEIQEIIDSNNPNIDFMICSPSTKRLYQEYCEKYHQDITVLELSNGFHCMAFNKIIPINPVLGIPDNVIYLINTADFELHQLCDWEWISDENNKILKQVSDKPIYEANLVKYADFMCHAPNNQIKIIFGE